MERGRLVRVSLRERKSRTRNQLDFVCGFFAPVLAKPRTRSRRAVRVPIKSLKAHLQRFAEYDR